MSKRKNPYENKVFLYTEECVLCGDAFPSDERFLRGAVQAAGKELVVKQITLFHGWREEAASLSRRFNISAPFYFDYDSDSVIEWNKVYEKTDNKYNPLSFNKKVFEEFLGGKNAQAGESESSDAKAN